MRELRATQPYRPLRTDQPAEVAAAILAALTFLEAREQMVWQWVVAPAGGDGTIDPWMVTATEGWHWMVRRLVAGTGVPDAAARRLAQEKASEPLLIATCRIAARGATRARTRELLRRLERAFARVSAPGARLVTRRSSAAALRNAATPVFQSPVVPNARELAALVAWPIGGPTIPGLAYGGGPLLPPASTLPNTGRVIGDAIAPGHMRPVALSEPASLEHLLTLAPTGGGKTTLLASLALEDIHTGRCVVVIDPKGGLVERITQRLPEERIPDCIVVDPSDEARPVPLPLLATEPGSSADLTTDDLVGILRQRYGDLGPRSTDLLQSSLYTLARIPASTLMDLFTLWTNAAYRARAVARVQGDPVLAGFWAWFGQLSEAERATILAAPMNKIRPLVARPRVRNLLAAPHGTFTMTDVLASRKVLLVNLAEGALGREVTNLVGSVLVARLWRAIQGRIRLSPVARRPAFVTIDEAPRFLDGAVDLGEMLVLAREYGVGVTIAAQTLAQFPKALRSMALNSARSKVSFQASADDAAALAREFGPLVTPEAFTGLPPFEALARLSIGGGVADPVSIRTRPLGDPIPGRATAVRAASRARYGLDRAETLAVFAPAQDEPMGGPVGRGRAS